MSSDNIQEKEEIIVYIKYTPLVDTIDDNNKWEWGYRVRQENWAQSEGGENDALDDKIRAYDFTVHEIVDGKDHKVYEERIEVNKRDYKKSDLLIIPVISDDEFNAKLEEINSKFPNVKYEIDGHIHYDGKKAIEEHLNGENHMYGFRPLELNIKNLES